MLRTTLRKTVLAAVALCLTLPQALLAVQKKSVQPPSRAAGKTSATVRKSTARATPKTARYVAPSATRQPRTARATLKPHWIATGPWRTPSYADSTFGDVLEGEDLVVRQAAAEALGPYNGSVVVVDPYTGRILSMVNQKLALKSAFQPCSTVKVVTALAGLSEGVVGRETMVRLYGRTRMNLTEAMATSNNPYFAHIGVKLGFEKVRYYAQLYGLGEKAGLGIEGEHPGVLVEESPRLGGVGMMTSFGEGISMTPLQLAALMSAIANGGTLYYLQYPRTPEQVAHFVPRVKRHLDIHEFLADVKPGLMAAVDHGTARRAGYDPNEPVLGKTGTCTDRTSPTHLGWFGSFNEVGRNKMVVVVLLTGGKAVNGGLAAGIAGDVYRGLSQKNFFAQERSLSPSAMVSLPTCCSR